MGQGTADVPRSSLMYGKVHALPLGDAAAMRQLWLTVGDRTSPRLKKKNDNDNDNNNKGKKKEKEKEPLNALAHKPYSLVYSLGRDSSSCSHLSTWPRTRRSNRTSRVAGRHCKW